MKNLVAILLALFCLLALSACDSADAPSELHDEEHTTHALLDACEHVSVVDAAIPATCQSTGLTEGSHCSLCGETLVAQAVLPVSDRHTPAEEKNGVVCCSVCGKTLKDNSRYTVTFLLGSTTLKTASLAEGEKIVAPTPGANQWYTWNGKVPDTMPAKSVTFSVTSIGGDAWANTTWEYDYKGKLSIHGKGNMSKFSENSQPWAPYKSDITSIVFDSTVTGIGKYAFFGCNRLTAVVIPDSILTVGDYAFANCDAIRSITIGSKVTAIGTGAFASSYDLERVEVRGALRWRASRDNYSTSIIFQANNPYGNAGIFKEYCDGKFTAES